MGITSANDPKVSWAWERGLLSRGCQHDPADDFASAEIVQRRVYIRERPSGYGDRRKTFAADEIEQFRNLGEASNV